MDHRDDLSASGTSLARQADEIIDQETEWPDLISQLTVDRLQRRDGYPDWHDSTPFRPMILSYLWARTEDISLTTIPDKLEANPELAEAFGFEPSDLPSNSTFKPCRIESRFAELESSVELAAKRIREVAVKQGAPIGYTLAEAVGGDTEEEQEITERTEQRLLRKTGKEVLEELKTVAIPSMSLPRPDNSIYNDNELLTLEAIAAINQSAANDGGVQLGDMKNPNPDPEDEFHKDGPTGETLLEAIKDMSVDEIADVMNWALRKTYTRAKPRLRELEHDNGSRFGVKANVAFDITYVAYYGGREEMEWCQGAPDDKGYEWCHKFATAVIVGENTHFVVGVCPLGSTEYADTTAYPGEDSSYYIGDVARRLLSIADEYVNVQMVYADREFHAADVIRAIEARHLNYVIPAQKNDVIARMCDRFDHQKRGYDEANDTPLVVKQNWPMHGLVKHETARTKIRSNIVILPPDEDDDVNDEGSPQPFLTNLDVSDETALDRRWARKQIEKYSDRGAIENSYSSIKECAAWTTSKEFEVRWFHFAFACIVYNMWLLVDLLTQERIGVIETRKKPRITLSRFLKWLDKELDSLL